MRLLEQRTVIRKLSCKRRGDANDPQYGHWPITSEEWDLGVEKDQAEVFYSVTFPDFALPARRPEVGGALSIEVQVLSEYI